MAESSSECPRMDRHLEMLAHREDGRLCVVASCLTGASWRGSVWIFDNPINAPDARAATAWAHSQSGNTDVAWLDDRRVLSSADDGSVKVWELREESKALKFAGQLSQHDDIVQTVSVAADGLGLVSGGWDSRIKVWDIEKEFCCQNLAGHVDTVYGVACNPSDAQVFLSVSEDGCAKLWDRRQKLAVKTIYETKQHGVGLRSIAWQPGDSGRIAVGDARGRIAFVEIGESSSDLITEYVVHSEAVNRLAFSPHHPSWLASASDDGTVIVTDISESNAVYSSSQHKDVVRGLAWNPAEDGVLRSCGLDSQLLCHSLMGTIEESGPASMETDNTEQKTN